MSLRAGWPAWAECVTCRVHWNIVELPFGPRTKRADAYFRKLHASHVQPIAETSTFRLDSSPSGETEF